MSTPRLTDLQAREIRAAAEEAGRIMVRELRNPHLAIHTKPDGSKVTSADYAADTFLKQELARITPDIPVLSEEDDPATQRAAMATGTYWAVDPLDGTSTAVRFAQGDASARYFGPLLGLVKDGVPVYGVAHYPLMDTHEAAPANDKAGLTYFTSADGQQSFRSEAGAVPVLLRVDKPPFGGPLNLGVAKDDPAFERLGGRKINQQRLEGSRILQVAENKTTLGYLDCPPAHSRPGYWDLAAHDALIRGAGGYLVTMDEGAIHMPNGNAFRQARPLRYDLPAKDSGPFHGPVVAGASEALRQIGVPVSRFEGIWREAPYR